jgi:hypothetical protein
MLSEYFDNDEEMEEDAEMNNFGDDEDEDGADFGMDDDENEDEEV